MVKDSNIIVKSGHNYYQIGSNTVKGGITLQTKSIHLPDAVINQTWLHYYNNYLKERQIITEQEWRKMRQLIEKKFHLKDA